LQWLSVTVAAQVERNNTDAREKRGTAVAHPGFAQWSKSKGE
jgi:hypothetical protein